LHAAFPGAEIIVYGHTHKPLLELVDTTITVMNPVGQGCRGLGSCPALGFWS
jgi:predicted phosphodiesterase